MKWLLFGEPGSKGRRRTTAVARRSADGEIAEAVAAAAPATAVSSCRHVVHVVVVVVVVRDDEDR